MTSLAVPSSCVVTQTPMGMNSGTRRRKRKFPLLFVNCDRGRIELTTYTVCTVVVGTAIRNSTRCAGRRDGRHNSCCSGLQYQPLQCRPYRGQFLYSTTICKLVDLIPALHQSDCRIPNWVSAKTVLSCSTNHGQTTARFRSFFR